jgi:hypothetical protein
VNDPFGLFEPKAKESGGTTYAILFAFVILVGALYYIWNEFGTPPMPDPEPGPNPVVKEGGSLVCILEKQSPTVDQELLIRALPDYVERNKLDSWIVLDKDLPEVAPVIRFASESGISPPFIVFSDKNRMMKSVIKWPKTIEGLKDL